ncbi:MAG: deoxyribonuclease V [Chromatiales bacterium]|jgi:deoxyribonuclease V
MKVKLQHPWDLKPADAIALQLQLGQHVIREDRLARPTRIAGVDVGFEDSGRITRAAVAVLDFPSLEPIEQAVDRQPTGFPYIPGLLSFREIPAILQALDRLKCPPDLLLCDGQGLAHPRRFGLACHLGLLTDIPSIGVGKTRLIGSHGAVPEDKGSWVPLIDKGEEIGAVLRTRRGVKPIYVSIGHRISLPTAIDYVLSATTRYKLPETTRAAHRLASG